MLGWTAQKKRKREDDEDGTKQDQTTNTVKRRRFDVVDLVTNVALPLCALAKETFMPVTRPPRIGDHVYVWRKCSYKHHGKHPEPSITC